jgi:beta-glucosidase
MLSFKTASCNRSLRTCAAIIFLGATPILSHGQAFAPSAATEQQITDLIGKMTVEEKISLVHGNTFFSTPAIPRLGIPERWLSDGPSGVRPDLGPNNYNEVRGRNGSATALPVGIALAATWDPTLAQAYGTVIGQEARSRGKSIMLGPGMNMMRTPLGGRSFEFLGEDPWLTSRLVVGFIKGEQAQGVASCAKHFVANDQDYARFNVDIEMDERTLREIYLPPFKAAVQEAGVLTVMGAYNKLRGQFCCENDPLLNGILKSEWGFQGMVISDWGGAHDTADCVKGGLDLEMGTSPPDKSKMGAPFLDGIEKGVYPMALLDDKVRRNLRVMFATHAFDQNGIPGSINTPEHQNTARTVAEQSMVLLRNEGNLLPLDVHNIKSLAVIGKNAKEEYSSSGGSSGIKPAYVITPLAGLQKYVDPSVKVTYVPGYGGNPKDAPRLEDEAVQAARNADVVIFVGGLNQSIGEDSEGGDRRDLHLPNGQDDLIQKLCQANPRTVVVLVSGTPVEMPWVDQAPAILEAWYPRMEGGNALARILFGDVNPSGKLPCTFPKALADTPTSQCQSYPPVHGVMTYKEGLLMGYRWYDTKQIAPLFPFGFGLSYTTFSYGSVQIVPGDGSTGPLATVQCAVTNSGKRAGAEVVQLYIHQAHPLLFRPEQELKGFQKVFLQPGETQTVSIPLQKEAFAYYDDKKSTWVADADDFEIRVGSSSRDIKGKGTYHLAQSISFK